jgi:hypothetical protein
VTTTPQAPRPTVRRYGAHAGSTRLAKSYKTLPIEKSVKRFEHTNVERDVITASRNKFRDG